DWTHTDTPVLNLDQLDTGHHDDTNPNLPINPDDPFYLPYTSGSTGTPKATLVPHRAIPGFFLGAGYASWTPHTTALLHSALSWDLHLLEILPPLTAGSRLIIHTDPDTNPLTVAHTAHATHVTTLFLSTASFNTVITTQPHLLTNIYHLIFGGETAIPTHVATALATLPHTHLYNAYGPVETTVWAMIHPITPDDLDQPGIPLGRPLGDRRIQLLNPDLTPTPPGQIGHLHISGPGLAHGYLNQPATTARHFTPDPTGPPGSRRYATGDLAQHTPDRRLIFHGRNDTQHKIRGYRVELAEIESRLLTHPNVAQVAVTTHPDPTGTLRLNAYLTTHGDRPTPDQLRNHLKPHLPDYMIPTGYHYLDALPTTHNGKINRKALQPPQLDAPPRQPAATPLHHTLTQIWSRSLGFASLAVDADLFELGAHSFTVAKAKARIAVAFQIDLPLRVFYTARTIDDQAEALMERAPSRPTLLRRAEEIAPLSELDDQAWVAAVARVPS
ncbi:non-ribosomal peptide synthetase, partial [Nonomuraea sp. NPDC050547]|uniref:non-ribosomal peptide synthetase n=1 Tax=Nonomuraea sp. NPDC050547 TaxID=3364368 RepID=UPI0037B215A2